MEYFTLSVVIPCYNASATIEELLTRLQKHLTLQKITYEIICVNDFSQDHTRDILRDLKISELRIIDLDENKGQFKSTLIGIQEAKGEFIVTIDDDLRFAPESISDLLFYIQDKPGLDIVIGNIKQENRSLYRKAGRGFAKLINILVFGQKGMNDLTSFRCMRRQFAQTLLTSFHPKGSFGSNILNTAQSIKSIEVFKNKTVNKASRYSLTKLLLLTFNPILYYWTYTRKILTLLCLIGLCLILFLYLNRFSLN